MIAKNTKSYGIFVLRVSYTVHGGTMYNHDHGDTIYLDKLDEADTLLQIIALFTSSQKGMVFRNVAVASQVGSAFHAFDRGGLATPFE